MTGNTDTQRDTFNALVDDGVYSKDFAHASPLVTFYREVMAEALIGLPTDRSLQVLDAGCGTGAWLAVLADLVAERGWQADLAGFDLSDRMVAVAHEKMQGRIDAGRLRQGSALEASAYCFADAPNGFDLIVAYDLIQQLPPSAQHGAVALMVAALRPGGQVILFDHDRDSPYGRKMAFKKFVTRYFFFPLVPRYYCNARYPSLQRLCQDFDQRTKTQCRLHSRPTLTKLAVQIITTE